MKTIDIFWQDRHLCFSEKEFDAFAGNFPVVEAAGGIVRTAFPEPRFLYIFRNGMWDLPKGKKEKGESDEENALREVQEETGLEELEIIRPAGHTYHFMRGADNVFRIKKTAWFLMRTPEARRPVPQIEEGIEKAEWLSVSEIRMKSGQMYASIANLSSRFLNVPCES